MSPTPERFRAARELFEELAELDTAARSARLDELAVRDAELAREVTSLFASDRAAGEFLEAPAQGWLADAGAEPALAPGTTVGAWRVLAPLGRGGMGEVYVAERADGAFEQRAALKLLKRGLDTQEIVRRFLRERQILARLTHPGIARLLDGGETTEGRPFLVLELVDGVPITEHCRAAGATVEARVRLLVEACDAVDAAHRSLIVHRDLKPSNVLVEPAGGRVKLLDFGIAKLLEGEDDESRLTRTGFVALTPAYAAPEQILGEPATTATDVYALGVLLYELLTGRLPHARAASSAAALAEAVSRESVVRPSRVAAETGDRRTERALSGDLDTIVLRALAREPERRYPTASALADDLRRHLDRRPVAARPDSVLYRTRKFAQRHRGAVAASALALVALVGGLVASLVQAARADRAAATARSEAARAESVRRFLVSVFEVSDPVRARGETVTAKALLDEGAARVDRELAGDPALRAEMQDLLAGLYRKLGEHEVARPLAAASLAERERLFGADSVEAASSALTLGWIEKDRGEFPAARALLEPAIARLDAAGGRSSVAAADAREPLVELEFGASGPAAAQPVAEARLAIYRRELPPHDPRIGLAWNDLGVVQYHQNRLDEAEAAYRQSLTILERLPESDPRRAFPHSNLAPLLSRRGRHDEAIAEARAALELRRRAQGPRHLETAHTLGQAALVLQRAGRSAEAEPFAREAVSLFAGRDRFNEANAIDTLATIVHGLGRPAEALELFERELELKRDLLPEGHVLALVTRINRAHALAALDRRREALAELEDVIPRLEALGGEGADALAKARELAAEVRAGSR